MTAGILLAAGESTRMGQLKALLPWRGTTLLESQLREMRAAELAPLLVVVGHRRADLEPLLAGASVVVNDRYREGKSTSIVAGVSALPTDVERAIVVAVDQPTEAAVLRQLAGAEGLLVLPSVNMRRGHPTLFGRELFPELRAISEEREGLREVMTRHEADIRYVPVETDIVRANLNAPEDYEAAFARWGQR
ncbi:MAG: nucleotidyltransferase family protein [Chloroflexi bacterium]|nr:nucleotidyltransferase family protein [Chloroflexota bacterium]